MKTKLSILVFLVLVMSSCNQTWVPRVGGTVYTLYTHSRGFNSTKYFRTVRAKILEIDGNAYQLEYLEDCYSGVSLSGIVKGLSKGYTYWERDGDVYETRTIARNRGVSNGWKLSE